MIIADTGFWLALIDLTDSHHQEAKKALKKHNEPLITTWCVITETCYLLLTRKGVKSQIHFLNSLDRGVFSVFNLEAHHTARITQLLEQYSDLPMDLADASLIILAEHLGHGRIFSVDRRDFNIYRWKQIHPFENLL
ncbi:type II toxin-antitoxin system VapC family toxin [Spirulina sp. 06S082]|uniref:type II toxin-antitoxin system VapC family toxin n=1 Tax=Spirulina sp. 06S082 TaxID=3110248 RepID=UPI002B220862|nr:PIN domain-containing protein [Spirulina sp. 06S082]MEA5468095.1 PIN domain-containing protein [Spirulina sp. 06S082]